MIPAEQLVPHDPDNKVYGDCFRAVLASLLEMKIEEVPHIMFDNPDVDTYNKRLHEFLEPMGFFYLQIPKWDFDAWKAGSFINGDVYHEISGDSPRFPGTLHSVVGCNGKMVHDPHPTKLGLASIEAFGFLVRKNCI